MTIDLLEQGMKALFDEVRRLRSENEHLEKINEKLSVALSDAILNREVSDCGEFTEKEELGFYIENQRKALGLSINHMARKLGCVSDVTLSKYEKGQGRIDLMREVVSKISEMRRSES